MIRFKHIPCLLVLSIPAAAWSADFAAATQALCAKTKECAMASMGADANITPEMKAMIMQSLDSVCATIDQQFTAAISSHELHDSAAACMQSMADMSCSELENMEDDSTQECADYYKLAEKYQG